MRIKLNSSYDLWLDTYTYCFPLKYFVGVCDFLIQRIYSWDIGIASYWGDELHLANPRLDKDKKVAL